VQTSAQTTPEKRLPLGARVQLEGSQEYGTVTGRADYLGDSTQYQVRYVNGQGCLTLAWWAASALRAADLVPASALHSSYGSFSDADRLAIAARFIWNGADSMTANDKAAFGIDTFSTTHNTPEELAARISTFLQAAAEHLAEQGKDAVLHKAT